MRLGLCLTFTHDGGRWIIWDYRSGFLGSGKETPLWERPYVKDEDTQGRGWPPDMRAEYERLLGRPEFIGVPRLEDAPPPNIVEMIADENDCAWDQKCRFGYRVDDHAVYCHNDKWLYSPNKCRRGEWMADWYGGEPEDYAHEKCPGFLPNPLFQP